jgi:DNA-binding MarR family transcriptional regulator
MAKNIETLIYEISLRVRLFMTSKRVGNTNIDLTDRECLLLELIGMRENMSISEISKLCPTVSNSTISTTITKLWKNRKLVDKKILPQNQRITTVSLTAQGRRVLNEIKKSQSEVYRTIALSLNLSPEQDEYFKAFIENAISFFNTKLGFKMELIESV